MSGRSFWALPVLLGALCAFAGAGTSGCGRVGFDPLPEPDAGADECPTPCENPHGTADCSSGDCELSCAIGFEDCDGDPANGCETRTADRVDSCGSCKTQCDNPHGATACADGLCAPRCDGGHGDCDGDPDNGCETRLTSTAHCGACDVDCTNANGTAACVDGVCEPTCASGHDDCDGDPDNGCEADTSNDPRHCGGCDSACGGSDQICVDGTCEASPCSAGRGECDGDLGVTCETDLTSDIEHCGFCTNVCATLNGTPTCVDGSCDVASCEPGYGNCDGDPADCEVDLATSTEHCGACDAACTNPHGTTRCASSSCEPSCESGWGDCDSSRENGCETPLDTVNNCGMCGMSCPTGGGTAVCNAGVCDTRCDLTGTFALYLRVFGEWPRTGEVDAGSGWFEWWMRLDANHSGDTASAQVRLCGGYVPPQDAWRWPDTSFLYAYPDSLYDGGGLPASSGTLSLGDSSADSSLTLPTVVLQLGIDMADPLNDPWPSQAADIPTGMRVDMDGDGNPGVTAVFSNENGYDYPRTSALVVSYADRAYVASRISFSLDGTLSGCSDSSGSATFPHVQARILGCRRVGGSGTCNASEADFLDDSAVSFTLSNATYTMTRVADGASCATIRSALP